MFFLFLPILLPVLFFLLLHIFLRLSKRRKSATILLTLSPGNHSPRALSHASPLLSSLQTHVFFLSYPPAPSSSNNELSHPQFTYQPITPPPHILSRFPTPFRLPLKLFCASCTLSYVLFRIALRPVRVDHIIVNTPPALPTFPVLFLLHFILFPYARLTIDWHNLAYTLLNASRSVRLLSRFLERKFAVAESHWAVSEAFSDHLCESFSLPSCTVLYDRPRRNFRPNNADNLWPTLVSLSTIIGPPLDLASGQHPILVSSTSWTPDEDFSILLRALLLLSAVTLRRGRKLAVVITGRGPLRAKFEEDIARAKLDSITLYLVWLPLNAYPQLLANATLGLSFHASSSGLDLPMKVVDMLACSLPVLALKYECIHELVRDNETGMLFKDHQQLATLLTKLLFEDNGKELESLRKNVIEKWSGDDMLWEKHWKERALPTLLNVKSKK